MGKDSIAQLKKFSVPKKFVKDEYICTEGQAGDEMYIILIGSVGIFVTNAIGELNQVAVMKEGGFFGEMAIFDNLPRSASCVALEDTVCVAINKTNLKEFLVTCPDIAIQMLNNMSGRIRKLNDDLYKTNHKKAKVAVDRFELPLEYRFSHNVKPPYHAPKLLMNSLQKCPICGNLVEIESLKRHMLEARSVDSDGRITYVGCEPLWKEIITCPKCEYTNHYLRFLDINVMEKEHIGRIIETEHLPIIKDSEDKRTEFDTLVLRYLQAIHINEWINPEENAWIGGLWRNLYWLVKDSMDEYFAKYCAERAIEKLKIAITENEIFDDTSRSTLALSIGSMLLFCERPREAIKYIDMATESPNEQVKKNALLIQSEIEKNADAIWK